MTRLDGIYCATLAVLWIVMTWLADPHGFRLAMLGDEERWS